MLLLYRQGDTYELVYDDAVIAAKILGLPVAANKISFHHADLEKNLHKLLRSGQRVAVAEQV